MPIIILVLALIFIGLILLLWRYRPKGQANQTINQNYHSIDEAAKKADAIITQAELEGIKIASGTGMEVALFEKELKGKLNQAVDGAVREYQKFLADLSQSTLKSQEDIELQVRQSINLVLSDFESKLSHFISLSEEKSTQTIELELQKERQSIDQYRKQQLALIDENIVAVLERTLSLVMRQKLTLQDQLDLIYEALKKAKIEKFFT